MNKKKFLALALAAAMSLSLAACGSSGSGSSGSGTAGGSQSSSGSDASTPAGEALSLIHIWSLMRATTPRPSWSRCGGIAKR